MNRLGALSRWHARLRLRYGRLLCLGIHTSPNAIYESLLASGEKEMFFSLRGHRGGGVGNKARLKETPSPELNSVVIPAEAGIQKKLDSRLNIAGMTERKFLYYQVNSRMGFTMIEIMVSATLSFLVFMVVISLYLGSQQSFDASRTYSDIYADTRLALDWMSKDIKGATQVLSNWTTIPGGGIYNSTLPLPDDCLILEIPSIDTSGDVIAGEYDHLIYHLNSNNLERIMDADHTVVGSGRIDRTNIIANNISSLIFSSTAIYLTDSSSIAIELTASRTRLNRIYQETLNSVVKLRNK